MTEQFENSYSTLLNGGVDDNDTTIVVDTAPINMTGSFRIKIDDEIILVGAVSGTFFTGCTRGVEDTIAASHSDNAPVAHILTAASLIAAVPAAFAIGAKVYNNTTQALTAGADRIITFNSEDFDTHGFHSTSLDTGRMTIPTGLGGVYHVVGHLYAFTVGADIRFRINGTNLQTDIRGITAAGNGFTISDIFQLDDGDWIEIVALVDGSVTVGHASAREAQNSLAIVRFGA